VGAGLAQGVDKAADKRRMDDVGSGPMVERPERKKIIIKGGGGGPKYKK